MGNDRAKPVPSQRATLKDVARLAGVAIGTADRVLNGTGIVLEKKRAAVTAAIRQLDYVPNAAARALSKKKAINIAVVYPDIETDFWEQIGRGIDKVQRHLGPYGLRIIRKNFKSYHVEEQERILGDLLEEETIHGLATVPVHNSRLNPLIDQMAARGIPVVTFDSDAPLSRRKCFIGEDNTRGGRIAGKLMGLFLRGRGRVAVLRGQRDLLGIQQRIAGFVEKVVTEFKEVDIVDFHDMYDDRDNYVDSIVRILQKIRDDGGNRIDGIFVTNGLVDVVAGKMKEIDPDSRRVLIGFDTSEKTEQLIREGIIHATVCIDLETEGYDVVRTLFDLLHDGIEPSIENNFASYFIRMREIISE